MMILCEIVLIVFKCPVDLIFHLKTEIRPLFSILTSLLRTYVFFIRIGIMVFNVTSKNKSVIRGGQLYWWRKPAALHSMMFYRVHFVMSGIRTCNFSGNMH